MDKHVYEPGMVKNTYGTGCFLLMNTGKEMIKSKMVLLTTIAWGVEWKGGICPGRKYFVAGASVQWLRDELRLINEPAESENYRL